MAARDSVFWPHFKRAGFLTEAAFAVIGCPTPKVVYVRFAMPDLETPNGSRSREYSIKYQHEDLPDLAEGDECVIDCVLYRVRERPQVPDDDSASGFFRIVRLSRMPT